MNTTLRVPLLILMAALPGLAAFAQPAPGANAPAAAQADDAASNPLTFEPAPDTPADTAVSGTQKSEIVELPRYVVTGERILPMPEFWRYTTLPGYEILSNASDRATKNFLKDFQQLQTSIQIIWPTLINQKASIPTLILLCARGDSFQPFIPQNRDPDIFITPTSLFVEDKERSAIVIDFTIQEVVDSSGLFSANDPYQQFYRQYARFLMRRANNNKPIPPWLDEGLSRLFSTLDFRKKTIEFGKIDENFGGGGTSAFSDYFASDEPAFLNPDADPTDPNAPVTEDLDPGKANKNPGFVTKSAAGRGDSRFGYLASMEKIFNPDPAKPPLNWSKQCYAFVHMCIYGNQKKYQKAFLKFARRAMMGPVEEKDFIECFGRTYKQMGVILRGYVEYPQHESILYRAKRGTDGLGEPQPVELREATQAEVGRIKGETLRLAGHNDASREAFIVPYLRHERDAGLLASLGLLESLEGRKDRARKFFEAAAKDNVVRPRAYVALARLRLDEALANPGSPDFRLSAAQTAAVLEPLFTARTQPPSMEDVYLLIGDAWLNSAVKPTPSNLDIMLEGAALFPRSTGVLYRAAALYTRYGSPETAGLIIKLGIKIAPDHATLQQFQELQASLPPPASASATTQP